jgi:DNA invertase Pin-like site-specific DNA recombinase
LRFARKGDTVLVHSLDWLARNLNDLRRLVSELTGRGVRVEFVKEGLAFDGSDSGMSVLLLNVMEAFAEFERSLIRERQREGIEIAKKKGVYTGRKPKLNAAQVVVIRERLAAGEKKAAVARELGISRETLYKHLRG